MESLLLDKKLKHITNLILEKKKSSQNKNKMKTKVFNNS